MKSVCFSEQVETPSTMLVQPLPELAASFQQFPTFSRRLQFASIFEQTSSSLEERSRKEREEREEIRSGVIEVIEGSDKLLG